MVMVSAPDLKLKTSEEISMPGPVTKNLAQRQSRPNLLAVTHLLARYTHNLSFGQYKAGKQVLQFLI